MNSLRDTYYRIVARLHSSISNERGQTAIEYALVAVLIAIVLVIALQSISLTTATTTINNRLNTVP